jgi:hypothetical protein
MIACGEGAAEPELKVPLVSGFGQFRGEKCCPLSACPEAETDSEGELFEEMNATRIENSALFI